MKNLLSLLSFGSKEKVNKFATSPFHMPEDFVDLIKMDDNQKKNLINETLEVLRSGSRSIATLKVFFGVDDRYGVRPNFSQFAKLVEELGGRILISRRDYRIQQPNKLSFGQRFSAMGADEFQYALGEFDICLANEETVSEFDALRHTIIGDKSEVAETLSNNILHVYSSWQEYGNFGVKPPYFGMSPVEQVKMFINEMNAKNAEQCQICVHGNELMKERSFVEAIGEASGEFWYDVLQKSWFTPAILETGPQNETYKEQWIELRRKPYSITERDAAVDLRNRQNKDDEARYQQLRQSSENL